MNALPLNYYWSSIRIKMEMTKDEIRQIVYEKKKQLSNEEINIRSQKLSEIFIASEEYKNSECIYAYMSFNQEIRTEHIISTAINDKKRVALPKVISKKEMEFIYISSIKECEMGYMKIPEPAFDPEKIANEKKVLLLIPGIAFDKKNNRVGYGGGYYDRYFSAHASTEFTTVALCYDFQLFEEIPVEEHDKKVDIIITE